MTDLLDRIRGALVGLKIPRGLEELDYTLRRLDAGEVTAIEAIDGLLSEEYATAQKLHHLRGHYPRRSAENANPACASRQVSARDALPPRACNDQRAYSQSDAYHHGANHARVGCIDVPPPAAFLPACQPAGGLERWPRNRPDQEPGVVVSLPRPDQLEDRPDRRQRASLGGGHGAVSGAADVDAARPLRQQHHGATRRLDDALSGALRRQHCAYAARRSRVHWPGMVRLSR